MSIIVVLYLLLSCITSLVVPWVGIIFYYILAVGQPEDMWPHLFGQGSRISLVMSLAVLAGLGLATATQQVDWRRLFVLPCLLMMAVTVALNLSVAVSPFGDWVDVKVYTLSSTEMLDIFNKIMIIFFAAVLLIDTRFKLITLITVIGSIFVLYALWANKVYFTNEFWRFGDNGRLNGPWGMYHDENFLGMLFVLVTPIFYYLSVGTNSRIIRLGLWACIPLSWHALFLTGSRGALLALAVTCIYIFFRSYSKAASSILLVGLVVAIVFQSGNMLNRVSDTVDTQELERERAFIENDDESPEIVGKPIDPRVTAWTVGFNIMKDYPLLGVGAANFMRAWPEYEDGDPLVAHSMLIQIGTSCGIGAIFVYLYFLWMRVRNVFSKPDPEKEYANGHNRDYLDDLVNSLFIAFYSVAFFLDVMIVELTYFVLLIGVCKYCLEIEKIPTLKSLIGSIYRWRQDGGQVEAVEEVRESAYASTLAVPVPLANASDARVVESANYAIYAMESEQQEEQQRDQQLREKQANKSQYAPASLYR